MSHLNFSISAPQPGAIRRRAWNPRSKVTLRSTSLVWTLVSIGAVAAAAFVVVWFA
jgi:hypothetical protein